MRKRFNYQVIVAIGTAAALLGSVELSAQDESGQERSSSSLLGESRAPAPSSPTRPSREQRPLSREVYLSELNQYLAASEGPLAVHLISAPGGDVTLREARFGAAISQILALRAGYRTVTVSRGSYPVDGRFNVIFGTRDALSSYLSDDEQARIKNGYVALRRFGNHRDGFLLIATGKTSDKVAEAIMSLGLLKQEFPEAPYASIRDVVLPDAAPFMRKAPLSAGEVYTFDQLKEAGALQSTRKAALSLDLFVPGYLSTDSEVPVSLTLRFETERKALSSNRPPQIHVNGMLVPTSQLVRREGDVLDVQFPFNWLKPGRNVIETERAGNGRSGYSGIAGDSTIELPDLDKHPALPDLQLATRAFYPFIGDPSGKDICVVLGSLEVATVESAWTFLAKLAQSSNTFFFQSEFSVGEMDPTRHNVIVAANDRLPAEVKDLVNFEALKQHRIVHREVDTPYTTGINLQMLIERAVKGEQTSQVTVEEPVDDVPHQWGFMASAPSAANQNLWNLVLTAASPGNLRSRTTDLVEPAFWEKIGTDISAWGTTPDSVRVRVPASIQNIYKNAKDVKFPTGDRLSVRLWYGCVATLMVFSMIVTCWLLGKCDMLILSRQRRPR